MQTSNGIAMLILEGDLLGHPVFQTDQVRVQFCELEEVPHGCVDVCNDIVSVSLHDGLSVFEPKMCYFDLVGQCAAFVVDMRTYVHFLHNGNWHALEVETFHEILLTWHQGLMLV
jgi:hypothetical protein